MSCPAGRVPAAILTLMLWGAAPVLAADPAPLAAMLSQELRAQMAELRRVAIAQLAAAEALHASDLRGPETAERVAEARRRRDEIEAMLRRIEGLDRPTDSPRP